MSIKILAFWLLWAGNMLINPDKQALTVKPNLNEPHQNELLSTVNIL